MLTSFNGMSIALSVEEGAIFNNNFYYTDFADDWDINKMHIVVLVHGSGSKQSVLQAMQIPLI